MIRTGYSFKTAIGHFDEVLSRLIETGWTAAPIADRNSTFGFNRWAKAASKAGLKPVFGVELGVVTEFGQKRPASDYWTFLALDDIKTINDIVYQATSNPGREPSLSYKQALSAGEVVAIAGERLQLDHVPAGAFLYSGLSPAMPRGQFKRIMDRGLPFVAMVNNLYTRQQDREFYRVALGRNSQTQTYPQHILSDEEWYDLMSWVPQDVRDTALANRKNILERCNASLRKATLLKPERPDTLENLCRVGAARLGVDLAAEPYASRLVHELKVIEEKGFEDYFYIIADLMAWAREIMVVGPARGSSCGSLVCYLLGITAIDPIPYGLLFERFLDITRTDLPDIDLDFSDRQRHLVFEYILKKYGSRRVARLGTVTMFQSKSALNQIGIALKIPRWQVDKVGENLETGSAGAEGNWLKATFEKSSVAKKFLEDNPNADLGIRLEDHPNTSSQHAAGVVITEDNLSNYVAVDAKTGATMCDKKDAEDLNLLKIDALGLTQLSIFERTLELIGQPARSDFLEKIETNDKKAFDVLNNGHFAGIFQFMGGALQGLTKQVKIESLNDIVAITALARPGPLDSGGAMSWVRRRAGMEPISYSHPLLEPILRETLGIVVFQEQVMRIGRDLGGLSWEDVTGLRRAMGKSQGPEAMERYGAPWRQGAMDRGLPDYIAEKIWKDLLTFGAYGFNKSHAVAYGLVSYWCCWLKAHHPVEFAAASLDAESDPQRQIALLRELDNEGIGYIPVDANLSRDRWSIATVSGKRVLVGPLTNIKGLGPSLVKEVLKARDDKTSVREVLKKHLKTASTAIDSLYPIKDKISELHPDLMALNIVSTPTEVISVQPGLRGDVMILAVAEKITVIDENEAERVEKRGGRTYTGPTAALNLWCHDDTDKIFCKIDRFLFDRLGKQIVERGRAGKALYAIKGTVPPSFRMISVKAIKYLGDLEDEHS